jgi:hypothetical protein
MDARHLICGTDNDMVGIGVTDNEVGPKDKGEVGIPHLMSFAIRHMNFERLKWAILKHLP